MSGPILILFVDDLWCTGDGRDIIVGAFGALQEGGDQPYEFHFETAALGDGQYGVEPVLSHIRQLPTIAAVVLDIKFGESGLPLGLDILTAIREQYPTLPVIMMTSVKKDNIDVVERAMALGANEYLIKKPTRAELEAVLDIYARPSSVEADFAIWGNSTAIREVRSVIARIASGGTASVLITGESGTGKELVARALHRQGPRRHGPFVDKNCANEKSDILDSDLFGHEKGAYTGAHKQHIGRIECAHKGTLFLDEIGSMSAELQGKLLRVLETRQFQRLGGTTDIKSDFQLVCATNDSPQEMVESGRLREDLYYRIRQIEVALPPLRKRIEDVPILAELFLRRFRASGGASYRAENFSQDALDRLASHSWPGNIRELRNVVERTIILCRASTIKQSDLPVEVVGAGGRSADASARSGRGLPKNPEDWAKFRVKQELQTLEAALNESNWNATTTAKYLFPLINSPSATYVKRYIKQLQKAPWGLSPDDDIKAVTKRILDRLGRGKS